MANTISVSVLADVKDINRKLGNVEGQLSGFGKKMSGLGKMVTGAFAAIGAIEVFKDVVKGASDAQQSLGATETVFGDFANTVIKTSDQAASKYGLSANAYRENANLIGSLFKNQGVAVDQLAGKTEGMIGKASDLAATFGGDTKGAVEALSSAFKGEFDPLEKYGISLKQSTVSAEAMRIANVKSAKDWNKLTVAQQRAATQQATTKLINDQSAASAGAFAKETNTLAHQQQVLAAKVQNTKDKIGGALLPVLTNIASFVSDTVLPKFEQFTAWFANEAWPKIQPFVTALKDNLLTALQNLGTFLTGTVVPGLQSFVGWLQQNAAWLMPIAVGITAMVAAYKAYTTYLAIVQAVTKAYIAVQTILNAVMSANPIGLLVLAVVGLVAALIYAWKNSETFRNIVTGVWNAIKSATLTVWNAVTGFLKGVWNTIKSVGSSVFNGVKSVVTTVWNAIKGTTSSVWNGIKSFISGAVNGIKSAVSGALNTIKSIWSSVWNGIKAVIKTIWAGIKAGLSGDIGGLVKIVGTIKGKVLGALAGAGSWLISVGKNIIQGLINGIGDMAGWLKNKIGSVINGAIDWAKGLLGIASPSKVFKQIGIYTGQGLVKGLDAMGSKIRNAAGDMAVEVETGFKQPKLALNAAGGIGTAGGNTYQITVNALDPTTAGRVVIDAIKDHERLNGSGWRQ